MTNQKDTRILRLFREFQAIRSEFGDVPEQTDEDDQKWYDQLCALEEKIMALPCTCAADFAAKAIIDTVDGGLFPDWKTGNIWKEARELVGMPLLGYQEDDLKAAKTRLENFAEWTGTEAPTEMLGEDGAPTDELLAYCRAEQLSLDWLFVGDEKGLVLGLRRRETEKAA